MAPDLRLTTPPQTGRPEDVRMRLRQAADRNRARLRAQGASTPIRGRLGRRLLGNLVARAGEQRDDGQSLLPLGATNGLRSLVFSLRTAIAGRPTGGKKLPPEPPESA